MNQKTCKNLARQSCKWMHTGTKILARFLQVFRFTCKILASFSIHLARILGRWIEKLATWIEKLSKVLQAFRFKCWGKGVTWFIFLPWLISCKILARIWQVLNQLARFLQVLNSLITRVFCITALRFTFLWVCTFDDHSIHFRVTRKWFKSLVLFSNVFF